MDRKEIKDKASRLNNLADFVQLLNEIKFNIEGTNKFPITSEIIYYYSKENLSLEDKYKKFEIPKKSGGVRIIYSPVKTLKKIQLYINELLQSLYLPKEYVTGFVRGRSIIDNAKPHIGHKYILCLDLKNFFTSISEDDVCLRLRKPPFNFKWIIARIITELCCVDMIQHDFTFKVLPQGAPTSPILANAVCDEMDKNIFLFTQKHNITYTRYADDITISSNENLWANINYNQFIKDLHDIIPFRINYKKTRVQRLGNRQEITGLIISDKINVKRKFIREIRNVLYIWERYGYDIAKVNFNKYYLENKTYIPNRANINMINIIEGKLQFVKMIKGSHDTTYKKLYNRFNDLKQRLNKTHIFPTETDKINSHNQSITEKRIKVILNSGLELQGTLISIDLNNGVKIKLAGSFVDIDIADIKSLEEITSVNSNSNNNQ